MKHLPNMDSIRKEININVGLKDFMSSKQTPDFTPKIPPLGNLIMTCPQAEIESWASQEHVPCKFFKIPLSVRNSQVLNQPSTITTAGGLNKKGTPPLSGLNNIIPLHLLFLAPLFFQCHKRKYKRETDCRQSKYMKDYHTSYLISNLSI